jgi:hypothetical protein
MSDFAPEELAVLARARRGLSPSARDAARVRAAVDVAVTAGAMPSASGGEPRPGLTSSAAPGMTAAAKLGAVVALAAATGFGGYVLGFRAGVAEREQRHLASVAAPAVVVAPAPVVSARGAEAAAPLRESNPDPSQVARSAKQERLAPSGSVDTGAVPSAGAATTATDPRETSLELETRLLARVERALRDDNARLALGLLGELDRTVPGGQLTEERQAARAMGHCALGSDSAPKLALAFVESHASSAYVPRVREACRAALEKKDAP